MKTKKLEIKEVKIGEIKMHNNQLKDVESCCGDCKGSGACTRIKVDFNSEIFEAQLPK